MSAWHTAKTGNHQGLIIDDATGRNVAVSYDAADAALIAAAPELLAALLELRHEIVFDPEGDLTREEFDAMFRRAGEVLSKVSP